MYPTSDAYKAAIRSTHVAVSTAEVWSGSLKLLDLDISGGSVSVSATSAVRRTCQVTFSTERGSALVPDNGFSALTPFGNELRLYRGIQYPDGSRELVPLGVFVITRVSVKDDADGVEMSVEGSDRSILVANNSWLNPYTVTAGSLTTALTSLLQDRYANVQINFPTIPEQVSQQVLGLDSDNDPWKDAVAVAEACGYDLYFDPLGVATLERFPDRDSASVDATYEENADAVLISLDRQDTVEQTYNGVIFIAEGSAIDTPLRVEVWDEDPTSPTYRYGPFGQRPIFLSQSAVTVYATALSSATALLSKYLGSQQSLSWQQIVDPSLDANDVIRIRNTGAKVDRLVIIDALTVPLSATEAMSATARTVRIVSGEVA